MNKTDKTNADRAGETLAEKRRRAAELQAAIDPPTGPKRFDVYTAEQLANLSDDELDAVLDRPDTQETLEAIREHARADLVRMGDIVRAYQDPRNSEAFRQGKFVPTHAMIADHLGHTPPKKRETDGRE